MVHHIAHNVNL